MKSLFFSAFKSVKACQKLWTLLMLFSFAMTAAWADSEGKCGDNVTWKYRTSDSTLIISGTGSTYDYNANTPWRDQQNLFKAIEKVIIEEGITHIGTWFLGALTNVTQVSLPEGLISIGSHAFVQCDSLRTILLPSTLKALGNNAFSNCRKLKSLTIPVSVETIGDWVFHECPSLESLKVEEGNRIYDSRDNCQAIIETASNVLWAGSKNTIIPSSVVGLRKDAFSHKAIAKITIPASLTSIGEYAFFDCTELTSITIPRSVTSIGDCAFCGCTSLDTVEVKWPIPLAVPKNTFYRSSKYILIVPSGCQFIYEEANPWGEFRHVMDDGEIAGLDPFHTIEDKPNASSKTYYLNGREATNKSEPLMPGLYIIRGEKVLIK